MIRFCYKNTSVSVFFVMKRVFSCALLLHVLIYSSSNEKAEELPESRIINKNPLRTPASRFDSVQEEDSSPKAELSLTLGIQNHHEYNSAFQHPFATSYKEQPSSLANFTFNAAILSRPTKQVYFSPSPGYPNARPANTPTTGIPCGGSQEWCVLDSNYPSDFVRTVITKHSELVQTLYSQLYRYSLDEQISYDNVTHSYRSKGHFSCESEVRWVRLGWAKDWKGKWQLVLNIPRFPQSIRMESCRYAGKRCEYLPPCYKSSCKQRNAQVFLIAMDPDKTNEPPFLATFFIPNSCSCFVDNFVYY